MRRFSLELKNKNKQADFKRQRFQLNQNQVKMDRYLSADISSNEPAKQKQIDKNRLIDAKKFSSALQLKINDKIFQAKSHKQIGLNTKYKQQIVNKRRSYSQTNKIKNQQKTTNNSVDYFLSNKTPIKPRSRINSLHHSKSLRQDAIDYIAIKFTSQCYNLQYKYEQNCQKGHTDDALQNLIDLLNYTIDIGNRAYFFKSLYIVCQFYQHLHMHKMALKVYCQLREAAILQKNYQYLIISLINIAKCASGVNLMKQSIILLKKALQYAWIIKNTEIQLNIYDEIGQKYCKMGQISKASKYHKKYSNSLVQPIDSSLRLLSKQKIQYIQSQNLEMNYQSLSALFLAHFNLPIKTAQKLPTLLPQLFSARCKIQQNVKFYQQPYQIQFQIRRLLKNWMFQSQTAQPNMENVNSSFKNQMAISKKYAYIQIKMNRQLREKGIKINAGRGNTNINQTSTEVKKKMSLEEKIKNFVSQPPLQDQWYGKLVKQVLTQQKRKLANVNDPVRLTKNNSTQKLKNSSFKLLFKQFINMLSKQQMKIKLNKPIMYQVA